MGGIDALLGEQTRPHKDLDVIMLLNDVVRMRELLSRDGYGLKELWSENRWAVDAHGIEIATAFVLQDSEGREFGAHAMHLDDRGNGVPAWEGEGFVFKRQDLAGEGIIAGVAVQCLSPEMQVLCHTGYELPDKQLRDADGPAQLEAVLVGLTESDLNLAQATGAWTIRQIVHHIADGDDIWKICIKAALGNSEGLYSNDSAGT